MSTFKKLTSYLLVSFGLYLFLNLGVYCYESYIELCLQNCDMNQNGRLEKNELTEACQKILQKSIGDNTRTFAPFTLIPISLFLGFFFYVLRSLLKKKSIRNTIQD